MMACGEFCKRTDPMKTVDTIQITDQRKPIFSPVIKERYNSKRKNGITKSIN